MGTHSPVSTEARFALCTSGAALMRTRMRTGARVGGEAFLRGRDRGRRFTILLRPKARRPPGEGEGKPERRTRQRLVITRGRARRGR